MIATDFVPPPSVPGTQLSAHPDCLTLQLAIESRVTSDDLQLAVSATDNKLVAMQSSVDSALSDRFRRMQNVVHEQASKTAVTPPNCIVGDNPMRSVSVLQRCQSYWSTDHGRARS